MNIVIFIGGLSGGGAERVVCNLSNFLSARHNVSIITMGDDKSAYVLSDKVKRIALTNNGERSNYLTRNISRLIRFRKQLKSINADVYLVMLPVTINLMLFHKKILTGPVIVSERNDPYTRYEGSKIRKWIMKKLYPKADGFVFQTESAMKYYREIIDNKGIIIPNAINKEFIKDTHEGQRKKKIVSAGRFVKQKNFTMLLEAFAKIHEEYSEYELVIYGDGKLKSELLRIARELRISKKVSFPGYVENFGEQIMDASLFILSSNYEGMPNALMEAMALGLPCIATDCPAGGPEYLINNGVNGYLVEVGNVNELADKMERILSDKVLMQKLGKSAQGIVKTLNPEKIYKQWEHYIEEVINDRA